MMSTIQQSLAYSFLLSTILFAGVAVSRPLPATFSDGVDVLRFKGIGRSSEEEFCEQMYGFLPCSKSMTGHLFLIVVYEFLLFRGESYVASGGERIFKILGPGVFGASAFQVIGSLPEALILLGKLFITAASSIS